MLVWWTLKFGRGQIVGRRGHYMGRFMCARLRNVSAGLAGAIPRQIDGTLSALLISLVRRATLECVCVA